MAPAVLSVHSFSLSLFFWTAFARRSSWYELTKSFLFVCLFFSFSFFSCLSLKAQSVIVKDTVITLNGTFLCRCTGDEDAADLRACLVQFVTVKRSE